MEPRIVLFIIIGLAVAGLIPLEQRLRKLPVSLPMCYVGLGWLVFSLPLNLGWLTPAFDHEQVTGAEYLTEMIVIISLMGLGLSLDREATWRGWKQVWPLLAVTMPLSIAGMAWMGWSWLGLTPAAAVLLGACLSPTDPVLARAVQVGPPGEDERDDVRFNLSTEAGFNDSLAFPFVHLAIALSSGSFSAGLLGHWLVLDVCWRILAGAVIGWAVGRLGAWLVFREMKDAKPGGSEDSDDLILSGSEGLIVISTLLIAYGVAELSEGYGFLAVFVGAVTARQTERRHNLHRRTHAFIDQIEKLILVITLVTFGGLLASGVLRSLDWPMALAGLLFLLVLRPATGWLAMAGSGLPTTGRLAVGFLGIRGLGSIYYLAHAQRVGDFDQLAPLWSAVAFVILASVVIHGMTAEAIMQRLKASDSHVEPGNAASVMESEDD